MSTSGASSSRSPPVSTHSGITQVNESLFELHKPPGTPSLQVLFFHGLQLGGYSNAHISTWESGDGTCIWPKTWLVDEFPDAHVLTVSYSGAMNAYSDGTIDMYIIIENLLSDLMEHNIGQVPYCPVILVGHSIGGLVIKALCSEAHEKLYKSRGSAKAKLEKFLENLRGLFFYASPNHGSEYANKLFNIINSTLLTFFKALSNDAARLNQEFNDTCKMHDRWLLAGLGEGLPTRLPTVLGLSENVLIVPEASARESDFQLMANVDHFSICKPKERNCRNFYKLKGFVKRIAQDMTEEAQHPANYQHLPASIAGIDDQLFEIVGKLINCQTLGLFGMGGLGKTTLAKAAFNTLGPKFEYTCFIRNVKKIEADVNTLMTSVCEQLHCRGRRVTEESNWFQLRGKTLLLVLDDISDDMSGMSGISILLNLVKTTSSESRVIVTSREQELEKTFDSTHHVRVLTTAAARQVFLNYAFSEKAGPSHTYEDLIKAIVSKCSGLPLALEVLGKYLYASNDKEWGHTLRALENGEVWSDIEKKLLAILRISYNGLNEKEKEMFLDATTFFSMSKWTLSEAKAAWRAAYGLENVELQWRTLVKLSLVHNVRDHECILVHEQLQYLGRSIASESAKKGKRRVWDGNKGTKVLTSTSSVKEQEILALHLGSWDNLGQDIHIPRSALRRLKSLQFLEVRGRVVIDEARRGESVITNLVLLRCSASRFGRSLLQRALRDHLVVLELEGPCESSTLPDCLVADPPSTLSKIGSELGSELDLVPEKYTSDMQSILRTIGDFSKLEFLDLHGCGCVQRLPQTFGQLSNLKHLKISAFRNLKSLPESLGQLSSLTCLGFYACNFTALPKSFGQLKELCDLEFFCCDEFYTLPESFGELEALSHLKFLRCSKLKSLPESFRKLKALSKLEFEYCKVLQALPMSFGDLKALSYLKFKECPKFESLPDSFVHLEALRRLEFVKCEGLHSFPEDFPEFVLSNDLVLLGGPTWSKTLKELRTLPDSSLEKLQRLHRLVFLHCSFQILPKSFGQQLKTLSQLDLQFCSALCSLPDSFGQLKTLSHLRLSSCEELQSLPESFGQLKSLSNLTLEHCKALQSLSESFGQLESLSNLELLSCEALESLPESFGQLKTLSYLRLSSCEELQSLPESFGQLKSLSNLTLEHCKALQSLSESFGQLKTLSYLRLSSCEALESLPESFGQLERLRYLELLSCEALESLPESFGQLKSLDKLTLARCKALQSLPESFGQLKKLR